MQLQQLCVRLCELNCWNKSRAWTVDTWLCPRRCIYSSSWSLFSSSFADLFDAKNDAHDFWWKQSWNERWSSWSRRRFKIFLAGSLARVLQSILLFSGSWLFEFACALSSLSFRRFSHKLSSKMPDLIVLCLLSYLVGYMFYLLYLLCLSPAGMKSNWAISSLSFFISFFFSSLANYCLSHKLSFIQFPFPSTSPSFPPSFCSSFVSNFFLSHHLSLPVCCTLHHCSLACYFIFVCHSLPIPRYAKARRKFWLRFDHDFSWFLA